MKPHTKVLAIILFMTGIAVGISNLGIIGYAAIGALFILFLASWKLDKKELIK